MESLLVVTNPDGDGSGDQGIPDSIGEAIAALRKQADVHVCRVSMPGDLDGALHRRGGRKIVVAGGDRDLHTVVGALHKRNELDNAVLAILPDGPESDFARSAGIPGDPARAADVVLHGVERRFDLLEDCRGDIVVSNVHLGVGGRQHRPRIWPMRSAGGEADAHGTDGSGTFDGPGLAGIPVLAALHALHDADHPRARPFHVRIEADDQVVTDFDRPVLQVAVTNSVPAQGAAGVGRGSGSDDGPDADGPAADADLADGYVDVVVNFAVDPLARARRALKLGHANDNDDTVTVRARRVSVAGQRFRLNSDGQDSGTERRCTWNVVPQRLRVIVPAGS